MLKQKTNPKSGKKEWALVSKSSGKALQYFGTKKPSKEVVNKAEGRVQAFKHGALSNYS